MKNNHKPFLFISTLIALFLSACAVKNKTAPPTVANTPEPNTRAIYYPSQTRLSDIIHMNLAINLNWDSCFVNGTAILNVKPYFYATDQLVLTANEFEILEIKMNNSICTYKYNKKELVIQLDRKYSKTENYFISIKYIAKPNKVKIKGSESITSDKGFYFINPSNKDKQKPRQFWTQGETEANSCWFPTIETGNEKFSQEIAITVENKFVTLSNGKLMYALQNSNGTRTDFWKQDLPHAPYLAMVAGGEFEIIKDTWRGMEVNYYLEPKYAPYGKLIFGKTPEMLEFFSHKLGVDYPWDKFSQIVVQDFVSGAMENTSAVTFFARMNMTDRDYLDNNFEEYISHELFHQWFGDLLTSESWPNLPLNESFATYGEYLWNEYKYGRAYADYAGQNDLNDYLLSSSKEKVDMIRFDLVDREAMFDANSYQKGGRILHMLRKVVGDEAFFASVQLYLEKNKFKSVEIHQLRLAFEEVTGQDLNWFFNEWFFAKGHPELLISYEYNEQTKKSKVNIEQKQNTTIAPLYKLPISLDFYSINKIERKEIVIDQRKQSFEFDFDTKPLLINADAEKSLLCTKIDQHSKEEWIYLFDHGQLYLDRMEALIGLKDSYKDDDVQKLIIKALDDQTFAIRSTALNLIKNFTEINKDLVFEKVSSMALQDKKSSVRSNAIKVLAKDFATKDKHEIYLSTMKDSSWSVASATLIALSKEEKLEAMQMAKLNEKTENGQMNRAIAELYAREGNAEEHSFFLNYFKRNPNSFGLLSIYPFYKTYLKRLTDEQIKEGVSIIKSIIIETSSAQIKSSTEVVLAEMLALAKSDELKNYIKQQMELLDKK